MAYNVKTVSKKWGHEEWFVNNELYCLKRLVIRPGGCCSLHYHNIKDETFVSQGKCFLEIGGKRYLLFPGATHRIAPRIQHKFWVMPEDRECTILEVSTHHDDNDVVRLEDSRILVPGEVP